MQCVDGADPVMANVHSGSLLIARFCCTLIAVLIFWSLKDWFDRFMVNALQIIRPNAFAIALGLFAFLLVQDMGVFCKLREVFNATTWYGN